MEKFDGLKKPAVKDFIEDISIGKIMLSKPWVRFWNFYTGT